MADDETLQNPTPQRAPAIWEKAFLRILSREGNVTAACKAAKVDRSWVYDLRHSAPDFKAKWDEALGAAADSLEKEAWRRATRGTRKPVYQGGKLVGHMQEYSDTLLLALLKAKRPTEFNQPVGLTIADDQPIPIRIVEVVKDNGSDD